MEDKREEKTVLCVFGEKEACSSNAAEERKRLLFRCIGGDYYNTRVTYARRSWGVCASKKVFQNVRM